MAWRCGSLSRSLFSAARTIPGRSSTSLLHRPSSPCLRSHLLHPRRPLVTVPRTMGILGCTRSLMPLHSTDAAARLTSHISVESRACCELSQASRARDYSSDGLDVSTNANMMIYGKTYSSEEEKRSRFKVCQDNNAFLTQHNQMYCSCTHCPNCLARVAHNQLPSYCDELPSPPPPEVNCRKSASEFFRGPKHPVGELTEEMRKKFSKSYEEDCPSATAFHMQHNQICHSCTHCPNCFAHVSHHQLPSYCCKLPLAPPPEGNSKNAVGHRRHAGGRSRKLEAKMIRQSYEGTALATEFSERFENWHNWRKQYSKTEEEKPVLSIARLRGKGILVEEDAEESGRVEKEWNEEIEW